MKAMQTTFISPTDSLSPRIKVSADGESMTFAWKSGLTIQENHHRAAVSFALSRDWLLGGLEVVTGWLAEGTYVHTFGPARDGSDCAMCGAYAPTADGMICNIGRKTSIRAFICSDCVHDNEVPSHPCDGCGVPVREDEYLGYDKPDGETEYKCENCFGEKYSGISEEERQWFPDGDDGFRLSKAAPDMLAALEAVIGFEAFCAPLNKIANASTVFAACRDAIAKAKGGE